jgi:ABC-type lipoprotein release transport system permease subunit
MVILGLIVGLVAIALGIPIALRLGLGEAAWNFVAVPPLAVLMAGIAALFPALMASRGSVVDVIQPGGRIRQSKLPLTTYGVGVRDLWNGRAGEVLLGAAAVALGSGLFAVVVVIAAGFHGQLNTTVLGNYLGGHVRGFHVALAAMTLVIGVCAVAEIVMLGYIERRAEFGMLRALGWSPRMVAQIIWGQSVTVGIIGGSIGAFVALGAGLLLGASSGILILGVTAALSSAFAGSIIAAVGPLALIYRTTPAAALKGE